MSSDSDNDSGAEDEVPQATQSGRTKMTLQVRDKSGAVLRCTTWADEPLRALMVHYCNKRGLRVGGGALRLMVDGQAVGLTTTPLTHDLEDMDIIDVAGEGVKA
eukprot:COSAG05_NODE_2713_length_2739_cov_2.401136_7_plen_104_part_00